MNTHLLHNVLRQFRASFLAFFSALTEQDYHTLLEEQSETLLELLQQRYGYTRPQAKAAWNEFVLRYVDGHDSKHRAGLSCIGALTVYLEVGSPRSSLPHASYQRIGSVSAPM
jgi:hypothetical protein